MSSDQSPPGAGQAGPTVSELMAELETARRASGPAPDHEDELDREI